MVTTWKSGNGARLTLCEPHAVKRWSVDGGRAQDQNTGDKWSAYRVRRGSHCQDCQRERQTHGTPAKLGS